MREFQLYGLGNALVDIFIDLRDEELPPLGFEKGSMRLVGPDEQRALLTRLLPGPVGDPSELASNDKLLRARARTLEIHTARPMPVSVESKLVGVTPARFTVLTAPGHTTGSLCYLLERPNLRALFAGDVVQHLSPATRGALGRGGLFSRRGYA